METNKPTEKKRVYELNSAGLLANNMDDAYIRMLTTVQQACENGYISGKVAATINTLVSSSYHAFIEHLGPTHDIVLR